jgi:exosortase
MYRLWIEDSNNSHGLLVPFISLFLIWKKRERINWENAKPSGIGLFILVVSLVFYIVGYAGGVEVLPRLTIVSTLVGLIIFNLGLDIFSILAFPLLFLFFMVPAPVSIVGLVSFPLQLIATEISAFIISSLSIPVLMEGNMLYFADTSLEVAEACSGIRSLVSYLMLGFLFAYLMNSAMKRRSILVFSAVPLAFFANLVRVTTTGILASFFGSRVARGFLHEFSGMAIFAFGFILIFVLYKLLDGTPKVDLEECKLL